MPALTKLFPERLVKKYSEFGTVSMRLPIIVVGSTTETVVKVVVVFGGVVLVVLVVVEVVVDVVDVVVVEVVDVAVVVFVVLVGQKSVCVRVA
jgi:hypothetical protein